MPLASPPTLPPSPRSSRSSDGAIDDGQTLPAKPEPTLLESEYSRRANRVIGLAHDLTSLGASQLEIDIPGIVFLGNQSAGKSSVVERSTGIPVPRDSGTCTRCPLQCTMLRSPGPWSCQITLLFAFQRGGMARSPPLSIPFQKVYRPADVEIWLRRAQAAVLNYPERKPEEFYHKTPHELKALISVSSFSLNTIELLVRDPEGTNLCFVDLPGIIHHHTQDISLVKLVKDIVERHIKKKNTIIVVTIPMTDDLETQEAFGIASRADPAGVRTIGVGTKPDLIGSGNTAALQTWKDILEGGASNNLKLGYYCVKLPDDVTRRKGLTRAELARQEGAFFESTEPWRSLSDTSCLGMQNFLDKTSDLLVTMIEQNIPAMKDTVKRLLDKTTEEIHGLPPLPVFETPYPSITISLFRFCKVVEGVINGMINKEFVHQNQARYDTFKAAIVKTTPNLQNSNGGNAKLGAWPSPIYVDQVQEVIRKHKTWELPGYVLFDATKELLLWHIQHWKQPLVDCFEDVSQATGAMINRIIEDDEHFGRFTQLQTFVKGIVAEQGQLFQIETSTMLRKIFDLENTVPIYTANQTLYSQARTNYLNILYPPNRGVSTHSDEHKVMADVHAFFHVAHMRFVDYVILCIEGEWHQRLIKSLGAKLIEGLPINSVEKMEAMLKEHPSIAAKRERLRKRLDQLTRIKTRLAEYEDEARMSSGFDVDAPIYD